MRHLIITENITIDGVIDTAGDWFAPGGGDDSDQSDVVDVLREQGAASDALLLGRVTFEDMRGYWPLQTYDRTGIADYLDNVNKFVVSKTLDEPNWANTSVLRGPVVEEVQTLKASPGADIVTTGSMTPSHATSSLRTSSTSTDCSCTRWSSGAVTGCSTTRPSFPR